MKMRWMGCAAVALCAAAPAVSVQAAVFAVVRAGPPGSAFPSVVRLSADGQPTPMTQMIAESFDGLAVGSGGTLYAATNALGAGGILTWNGATGAYLGRIVNELPNRGEGRLTSYVVPGGIAVGPDGHLYATTNYLLRDLDDPGSFPNGFNGLIRFDAVTGADLGHPITLPPRQEFFDFRVRDVAFGPDGRAYITAGEDGILRTGGASPAGETFVAAGSGGLEFPEGLTFGPDGNLYVANRETASILRFNGTTGVFMNTFVPAGAGGMGVPADLLFDASGDLLVASSTNAILRFDGATGAFDGAFATFPAGHQVYVLAADPVPEPSLAGIAAVAAGAAAVVRRRRR